MKSIEKLPKLAPVEVTLTAEQARLAVLASECSSEDPTRASLNGVYVQVVDGEFQAHASDGARAVVLTCPAGETLGRGHLTPSALALLKTVPRKVPSGYRVPTVRLEPSDFPNLAPVLALSGEDGGGWHGNPNLLAPLAAFCNFYAKKKDGARVTILPGGEMGPMRCEVSMEQGEVVGLMVVMPCRRVMP